MKKLLIILISSSFLFSCKKDYQAPVPDFASWAPFNDPSAASLNIVSRSALEGVYTLDKGADMFGGLAAVKWSYTHNGNDTTFHVSGFFGKDISYFICQGKRLNDSILFNGYWRKMVSTETGIVRLTIGANEGGSLILSRNPVVTRGSIVIKGMFGNGNELPGNELSMVYERKLNNSLSPFLIMAHRSGGRTSDLLPASENSVEMILKTPEFGSTGIEIDVRYTSDGVPILYHDNTLNLRVVRKSGLTGEIKNYSFSQLSTFIRLINGEKIPTLRQALDAVVYRTDLRFVWLDTKFDGPIDEVRAIQKEYLQKAAAAGRSLNIVIGIPGEDQFNSFIALPNYQNTPSLCELSIEQVEQCNALVWAPRFTEGPQNEKVALIHGQGRLAFVWTLDVPEYITNFIQNGHFDAILSNYPTCVAFNYYVHQ
ncbi:MAG: glycerophosphodiester phosphodiesterase [Ferruginibacter sp.]|nr:glycerophosphodiester phosphodiesterase [Ferruginibacter sp.]